MSSHKLNIFVAVGSSIIGFSAAFVGLWATYNVLHNSKIFEPFSLVILTCGALVGFGVGSMLNSKRKNQSTDMNASDSLNDMQSSTMRPEPAQESEFATVSIPEVVIKKRKQSVFLSYRRDDSDYIAGRIYDRLISQFGEQNVFKDIDSIGIGKDYREVIRSAIESASVVLVIMGKNWIGTTADTNEIRIQDETDFVRTEVAIALRSEKVVIPVFVANAKLPNKSDLPDDIQAICFRNGIKVRPDPDFSNDVDRLIKGILDS